MLPIRLGATVYVLRWTGFSGCTARYRLGRAGSRWPTFYMGPVVVHTGPA